MVNYVGFRGFAKPATVPADLVRTKIETARLSDLFVYYTGKPYRGRAGSGRSAALATVTEVGTPVPLSVLVERAAVARGDTGYTPDFVRSGLFLHRNSKPAVYYPLRRRDDGSFVAAANIPFPSDRDAAIAEGTVIVPAPATPAAPAVAAPAPVAALPAPRGKGKGKGRK